MISVQFNERDLARIRFVVSPLSELAMSYWMLHRPEHHPYHEVWLDEMRRALNGINLPYMDAMVLNRGYIADFLTPSPMLVADDIETELDNLHCVPEHLIRQNIQMIVNNRVKDEVLEHYLTRPHEALECLIGELRLYWHYTLAHHWSRIRRILEGDILYRARQIATCGLAAMLNNLDKIVRYEDQQLVIVKHWDKMETTTRDLAGSGIQLMPSFFRTSGISWLLAPEWYPILIYTARGAGQMSEVVTPPDQGLSLMLGAGKAKLLVALQQPTTTTDLAEKLSITAGAVSQQVKRLQQAGLIDSLRMGSYIYHQLSERGVRLLDLFGDVSG